MVQDGGRAVSSANSMSLSQTGTSLFWLVLIDQRYGKGCQNLGLAAWAGGEPQ